MTTRASEPLPTHEILASQAPWLAPAMVTGCAVAAATCVVAGAKSVPFLTHRIEGLAERGDSFLKVGLVLLAGVGVAALVEQIRRWSRTKKPVPLFIRLNRAVAYGVLGVVAVLCIGVSLDPGLWLSLLYDPTAQTTSAGATVAASLAAYLGILHPWKRRLRAASTSLREAVFSRTDVFEYVLGRARGEDWENAERGDPEWVTLSERGTYGNVFCVGQIGSGKTSQIADPLVLQILTKRRADPERRPSLVVLDLKGNQTERYYRWAQALGRGDELSVVRPDVNDAISKDRYVAFNALSGWDDSDLLAIELQEALESTKERRSPEYFQSVQQEFLLHTLRVLQAHDERAPDLVDVQQFGASDEARTNVLRHAESRAEPGSLLWDSIRYFRDEFGTLSPQDRASLLRGLASQLTLLTNRAVRAAFCPTRTDERRTFYDWTAEILDRPGIVVFSCPPAKYTDGLSRLLGLLFLKNLQQALLRRCDGQFDGNRERPVYLVIDEAHAFVNSKLADFLSVSRECRVSSILLTQSISQIPRDYRPILLSNTRTRIVLSVADETAREMSVALGEVEELRETRSVGNSLQDVRHGALSGHRAGRSAGASESRSYTPASRPRFSPHALQHLPPFRAIAHVFDGDKQEEARMIETIAWYRLPYFLLSPDSHPNVACRAGEGSVVTLHEYRKKGGRLTCARCGHAVDEPWAVEDFEAHKREIVKWFQRAD